MVGIRRDVAEPSGDDISGSTAELSLAAVASVVWVAPVADAGHIGKHDVADSLRLRVKAMAVLGFAVSAAAICEHAVQNGDIDALRLDEVNACDGKGEVGIIGAGDVALFREVPGGELEVVAGEAHTLLDFGE